jgi:SAM-dependent methyltransferase
MEKSMNNMADFDFDDLPKSFFKQQYSRSAMYISHSRLIAKSLYAIEKDSLKLIEFGGSNGFIRELFNCPGYEVAENFPIVDIHDLHQYKTNHFDFVILDEILEHVARPQVAIGEVYRILKEGGCLITSTPFMIAEHKVPEDYWRFTKSGIRELLRDFQIVETHSWGNPSSVTYLMEGMMVTVQETIESGKFDLSNIEKYAVSVWAYAWK